MGNVQPNYDATLSAGYEGQIADTRLSDIISRICEPASIGFGLAVIRGTAANEVKLGAAGEFVGLSVRDLALPAANEDVYLVGNTMGVMVKGTMFAKAIAAVTHGDKVYRTPTGTLTNVIGDRTASSAAKAGGNAANTGTMGTVTVSGDIPNGVYKLRITAAASNAGSFVITDESGAVIGPVGTVAVAYSFGGLAFTLADGSQDFIVGEGFDITVTGGNTVIEGARWLDTLAENAIGRVRLN
jgi:hypothetical protein